MTTERRSVKKRKIDLVGIAAYVFLAAFTFLSVFPWFWNLLSSFKTTTDIWARPPLFIFDPTLNNYYSAFVTRNFALFLKNTIVVGLSATALCLVIGVPAAYAFSRFKTFIGNNQLFFFILTTRMAPGFVEIIPLYLIFKNIGLLGSPIALVFAHVYVNLAFVIWLMKGFFDDITVDLDERAMIDGASRIRAFFQLILPLTLPGLVTTAIFVLIFSWNEFLFALILTGGLSRTLPVAIPGLVTPAGTYWGEVMAVATVITVPILIFATAVRKYLVRGLTFGAVK